MAILFEIMCKDCNQENYYSYEPQSKQDFTCEWCNGDLNEDDVYEIVDNKRRYFVREREIK